MMHVISIDEAKQALRLKRGYAVYPDGARKIKSGYACEYSFEPRPLPDGYTQVEYIENTSKQYINTGFIPNQDTRIVLSAQFTNNSDTNQWLYCGRTATYVDAVGGFFTVKEFGASYGTQQNTTAFVLSEPLARLNIDHNKNSITLNGDTVSFTAETFTSAAPITLLARNTNGTIAEYAYAKLFSCQIYDNGTLVRDYVPCVNADSVAGLYDLVNSSFASNSGTGVFKEGDAHKLVAHRFFVSQLQGSISTTATTLTLNGPVGTTKTTTITKTGDGEVTATSSNNSVVTATVSGNTLTVKLVASGSATITLNLAESDDYTSTSCKIAVTASIPSYSATLNDNSWEAIASASEAGMAPELWDVGDTKTETFDGKSYTFRIIGFDHDKLNSADAKYNDSNYNGGKKKAGITFEMSVVYGSTTYRMNSSNTNAGGWNGSYMRSDVMQTMKLYMPAELKNVLRTVSKLASAGTQSSTIKTSADQLFLLSEVEVFGTTNFSFAGEGTQYAYYAAGNSPIKKQVSTTYARDWWLRSPKSDHNSTFVYVQSSGLIGASNAGSYKYVSFCFCI